MAKFYVYCLRRPDRDDPFEPGRGCPFYVGKGSNGRKNEHRKEAKALLNKIGQKSIKIKIIHKLWKQGLDFEIDILFDSFSEQGAFEYEMEAIAAYGRVDLGTGCLSNLTDGGEGTANPSIKTRQKLAQAHIGSIPWNKGQKWTEEVKQKISEANTGKTRTEAQKQVLKGRPSWNKGMKGLQSSWNKGGVLSEETRRKISEARIGRFGGDNNPMYGKKRPDLAERNKLGLQKGIKFSQEHRMRISEACKGRVPWNKGLKREKVNG